MSVTPVRVMTETPSAAGVSNEAVLVTARLLATPVSMTALTTPSVPLKKNTSLALLSPPTMPVLPRVAALFRV